MVAAARGLASAGAGNVGSGAQVALNLSSRSRLGGTLAVLVGAVLGLRLVLVALVDGDGTLDFEGSLGDLLLGGLSLTLALGLTDLSLVGDGVLIGDHNLLSADLGLGTSGLGGELGVGTGSVGGRKDGFGTLEGEGTTVLIRSSSEEAIAVGGGSRSARLRAAARVATSVVVAHGLEGSSRGSAEKSKNSEGFHLFVNVLDY